MMTATECPTHDRLKALTLGQLSNEDSDALFQHINECDACRTELETVEDMGDSLIVSLRDPVEQDEYSAEPDCRLAVVKALGALAQSENSEPTAEVKPLPKTIGEYEIVRPIGSGGMGNVFLARHTKLGRQVALKVLASHRLADTRMLERFEAEMRAVGQLSHPNIVTAHDAREVDGTAVLVTEFVSGLDLGQLLQRTGPLNVANACEIVRQVSAALAYTNSQGFVHRDIKPSNIMLSAEGDIKLLDLGLARLQYGETERTEITGTGQALGTADYVAPEQVTDSKTVDIRADIYALGCTLFKLLTGRAPFADDQHVTSFAKMTAHVSKRPPSLVTILPSAPRNLVQLVDSMLAKQPDDRPQLPQEIAAALASLCNGHDLRKLISDAEALESRKQTVAITSSIVKPKTQSWMERTVPFSIAIASGFLGVLLGVCLSIVIIITNPDGTRSLLRLAEGSKVELHEEKPGGVDPAGTKQRSNDSYSSQDPNDLLNHAPNENAANSDITPLSFGILVNRDSTRHSPSANETQIVEATRLLRASDGSKPVRTLIGTWYVAADPDLGAPIKELNAGKQFVLVSDQKTIRWPEIQGQVLSTQTNHGQRETTIELRLDKQLGSQLAKLTKENVRNQLAIIVNGQVRSAPVINSEVGESVLITGVFEPGEAKQLSQWLHGGLIDPLPKTSTNSQESLPQEPTVTTITKEIMPSQMSQWLRGGLIDPLRKATADPRASSSQSPSISQRIVSSHEQLEKNLKLIGLAFHNFHDAHGRFPGTANTHDVRGSSAGKKIYPFSWRVAILPYLEQIELYEQYRFDEKWDSEHNLKLLEKMPAIYRSPFAPEDQEAGETNMLGFASEDSALGTGGGESLSTFTDGSSNTLLLIEAECTLPWTKPQDIPGDAGQARFFEDHLFVYLLADGSVNTAQTRPTDEVLNGMISRKTGKQKTIPR